MNFGAFQGAGLGFPLFCSNMSTQFPKGNEQLITSSKSWVVPGTGNYVFFAIGAGGSGASISNGRAVGGGAGGLAIKSIYLKVNSVIVVTIGAGGAGVSGAAGNNGGATTVSGPGISLFAGGGLGGSTPISVATRGVNSGVSGGFAFGGDYNLQGGGSGSVEHQASLFSGGAWSGGGAVAWFGQAYNSGNASNGGDNEYHQAFSGGAGVGGNGGNATASGVNSVAAGGGGGSFGSGGAATSTAGATVNGAASSDISIFTGTTTIAIPSLFYAVGGGTAGSAAVNAGIGGGTGARTGTTTSGAFAGTGAGSTGVPGIGGGSGAHTSTTAAGGSGAVIIVWGP